MDKVELTPLEWYAKVNEALTIAFRDINNEIYPQEQHIEVMRALYYIYDNGSLPIYKNGSQTTNDIISQGMLFGDNTSDNKGGTDIDAPQGNV